MPNEEKLLFKEILNIVYKTAVNFYNYSIDYENESRLKKLEITVYQIKEQIKLDKFALADVEEGVTQACKEFSDEGNYYMPPAIKIIDCIKNISFRKSEYEKSSGGNIELATEQNKRREQFKIDFYNSLPREEAEMIISEFCWRSNYTAKQKFYRETFFGDFFCHDSLAKAIIVEYGIDIRKESGERYT